MKLPWQRAAAVAPFVAQPGSGLEAEHALVAGHLSHAVDHDPVLGAVRVLLKAQAGTGLHHDPFDLEVLAFVDAVVMPPRAVHLPVVHVLAAAGGLQRIDDRLDVLDALAEQGLISDSRRAKSAYLTEDGVDRARALLERFGIPS